MIGLVFGWVLLAAQCHCPPTALSRDPIAVPHSPTSGAGFVACGFTEDRRGEIVVASELEIFACGAKGQALLQLDATQTALLRATSAVLEITEVSRWPFGRDWEWVEVPIFKWRLAYGAETIPAREIVLTRRRYRKQL